MVSMDVLRIWVRCKNKELPNPLGVRESQILRCEEWNNPLQLILS